MKLQHFFCYFFFAFQSISLKFYGHFFWFSICVFRKVFGSKFSDIFDFCNNWHCSNENHCVKKKIKLKMMSDMINLNLIHFSAHYIEYSYCSKYGTWADFRHTLIIFYRYDYDKSYSIFTIWTWNMKDCTWCKQSSTDYSIVLIESERKFWCTFHGTLLEFPIYKIILEKVA